MSSIRPVRIACFAVGDRAHLRRLATVVPHLVAGGAQVRVWGPSSAATDSLEAGATFADLHASRPLAAADDRSRPLPARFVTFAAVHAADVADEVAAWQPDLLVVEGFAVIGRVVAHRLRLPWVLLLAGHAVEADEFRRALAADPRVALDPRCDAAVRRLASEHGFPDASPFSFVARPSPWLNVANEPAEWLSAAEQARLAPLACFGALADSALTAPPAKPHRVLRLYVAFGTVIWRYFAARAHAALLGIVEAIAARSDTRAVVSLGGAELDEGLMAALVRENVGVSRWVDQWQVLGDTDVFVTHHGLGSTHEAVARGVPMISFPFFWDQPGLAKRTQSLGLAVPLPDEVDSSAFQAALERVIATRTELAARLATARKWEATAHVERPAIAQRIIALAGRTEPP